MTRKTEPETIGERLDDVRLLIKADFRSNLIEGFLYWRLLYEFVMDYLPNTDDIDITQDDYDELVSKFNDLKVYQVDALQYSDFRKYIKEMNNMLYALFIQHEESLQLNQCEKEIEMLKKKGEKPITIFIAVQQLIFQCAASGSIILTDMMKIENFLYTQVINSFLLSLKSNNIENEKRGIKNSDIEDIENKFMSYNFFTSDKYKEFKQDVKKINSKMMPVLEGFEDFVEFNECERVIKEIRNPAYPK